MINHTAMIRILAGALFALAATSAQAISLNGVFGSGNNFSLIHEGDSVPASNAREDWLFFPENVPISFEINGDTLTASGPIDIVLSSENGATADFQFINLTVDISGPNGMAGGELEYSLDGVVGTFIFLEDTYGSTSFNSSSFNGNDFTVYLWGGDALNELGIDLVIEGTIVPLPGALWFLGSALLGMGVLRRR